MPATEPAPDDLIPPDPVPPDPPPVGSPSRVTGISAADFVEMDHDRPKADENAEAGSAPAPLQTPPPGVTKNGKPIGRPKGAKGKPHRSKAQIEAFEKARAAAAAARANRPPPPSFSDLPPAAGGAAPGPAVSPMAQEEPVNYRANAEGLLTIGTNLLAQALGDQWRVKDPNEEEMMVGSLAKYMEYKKWADLSPGWGLAMVLAMYAIPRAQDPATKAKLKEFAAQFKPKEPAESTVQPFDPLSGVPIMEVP